LSPHFYILAAVNVQPQCPRGHSLQIASIDEEEDRQAVHVLSRVSKILIQIFKSNQGAQRLSLIFLTKAPA